MLAKYMDKVLSIFEHIIVVVLMMTMLVAVCYATYLMIDGMFFRILSVNLPEMIKNDPDLLQKSLYRMFGNMLTILLGMELIHTIKIYFKENIVKIELIMVISIIAMARHLIQLDYHDVDPMLLVGMAALMAVFIGGYLLMLKGQYVLTKNEAPDDSSISS